SGGRAACDPGPPRICRRPQRRLFLRGRRASWPRYTVRVSPARRVLAYLRPYAARYGVGFACLALATGLSLGIPWQVKEAVDDLRAGGHTLGFHSAVIVGLAFLHGLARLGSRFTILGAG